MLALVMLDVSSMENSVSSSVCEGAAQEVGPKDDSQQAMQEAKLRVANREQPRREPETTDADLLRHGSAPRLGLLAFLLLGVDMRLEHDFDVASKRSSIRLRQAV